MFIASVVASSFFIVAMIGIATFLVSYAVYTKNRLFIKSKYSILILVLGAIIFAGLIGLGSYLVVQSNKVTNKNQYIIQYIMIFALSFLVLANYVAYIVITTLNNKNKIDYKNISSIDWNKKILDLKNNVNIDAVKTKLSTKNKVYFQNMMVAYQEILVKAKDPNSTEASKIADIVMFNDTFTHKWSTYNNNYQLLLTYEFCKIFQK